MTELHEEIEALRRDPTSNDVANIVRKRAREDGEDAALRDYARAFAERGALLAARSLNKEAINSLVEAALVYEEELEDLEAAADLYKHVLEIESDHRRALFALGLIMHDLQKWEELIAIYRRRLERCRDDGERTTLHLYTAELLSEKLGDDRAAFTEVTTAARLAPRNLRIISRLETLGERTGKIEEVAVVIGDLILHQDDPRVRAALSLRLAELHLGPIDDPQRALAYLRAALADDGGNPEILSEVEDVFRERARFDELAEILEDAIKDRRVGPQRVRLERELARIYELELGDLKRALLAMTRAAKNAPDDRELLDEVMRLGLVTGEMDTVAQTFEEVCRKTENGLLRTYMRLKLGHIYAATLARPEDAIRVYWAILDDDPSHKEARRRLHVQHERRGDHREIARLLELETQGPDGPGSVDALRRLAVIRRDRLDDRAGAVEAWRRILDVVPDDQEALNAVGAREPEEPVPPRGAGVAAMRPPPPPPPKDDDDPEDLADRVGTSAIETRADEMPTDFEGKSFGPESETNFGSEHSGPAAPVIALPTVEDVRPKGPPPPPPPDEEAVAILMSLDRARPSEEVAASQIEHVSDAQPPHLTLVEPLSDDSIPIPAPLLAKKLEQELDERIVQLQQELQEATRGEDRARQVEILEEIVRAHERLGHEERAFFAVVRLVQLEPTAERLKDTIRLGRKAQGYPLLVDTVQTIARKMGLAAELEFGLLLAEVELEDLRDVGAAVTRLASLSRSAPEDRAIFERWTIILDVSRRYAELVDVLKERALHTLGSSDALAMIRRAAQICEVNLEDPKGAAELLIAYLEGAPERDDLREDAAELLEKAEAWRELVALLEGGIDRLEGAERVAVRLQIARLYLDRLGDAKAAEETLRLGLAERARDPELLSLLEEIYETREDWSELVEILQRRLDVVKGARGRNTLRRKIASVAEERLGKIELALEVLGDAIREDRADLDVLTDLERLRRSREDWEGVREVLVLRSRSLDDPLERASALVAIAMIHADAHGDLDGAASSLRDALAIAPKSNEALDSLAVVEERRGDYLSAISSLRRLAAEVDGAGRARVYVRIGRIIERRLEDTEAATSEYQAAYDADPHCLDAILALLRIRELEEDFAQAAELAARAATLTDDERDKAALWRRAAHLAQDRVGDELRALEYYERALALDPEDLATTATAGELLLARQDSARAYPYLRRAAEGLSDPERTAYLFSAAGQAAEKLKLEVEAVQAYEAALARAPKAFEPLRRLSVLLEKKESWPRVYELCAALILHHESSLVPMERANVYLRMSRAKRAASELDASVRLARKAHQLADTLIEPLALLADVLAESGEAFDAAECLKKISQLSRAPQDKRNALFRAAVLLADQAQDLARGAAMLAEAQTFVPDDIEVAELLAGYREKLNDARGAAAALAVPARLLTGRARADLLVRAARISAGPARDRLQAKQHLRDALDIVPTHQDALGDLSVMLEFDEELEELARRLEAASSAFLEDPSTARDAPELDRKAAARKLLDEALRLYRLRLADPERALAALRKLLELAPADERYREDFARLLDRAAERDPKNAEGLVREAIGAWAGLVEDQPGYLEGLRRLRVLRARAGEHALARLAEELLAALGDQAPSANGAGRIDGAAAEETMSRPPLGRLKVDVPPHPHEVSALETLFTELGYAPIRAFFDVLPEPKPKKRDLVGAAGLGISVSRPLEYACGVLGMEVPPVYVRDDAFESVQPALVLDQPGLIVSLAMASKQSPAEMRFIMARALSLLRPRALALATIPIDVLRDGLAGFAKPALPPEAFFGDGKRAKKLGRALEKALPAADRNRLAEAVGKWMAEPERRTLAAERAAVLRTADRAGLVVSGSLSAAIGALRALSEGRIERAWHLPLIEYAATRGFADIVRRLS